MVLKPKLGVVAALALSAIAFTGVLATPRASEGSLTASACSANQLEAALSKLEAKLACYKRVVRQGASLSTDPGTNLRKCLDEAEDDFDGAFDKATKAEDCNPDVSSWELENEVDDAVDCIVGCVLWDNCGCVNSCD
jgi:hypothetical protein